MREQALNSIRRKYKDESVVFDMAQVLGLEDILATKEHEPTIG